MSDLTLRVALSEPERDFLLIACGVVAPASSRSRPGAGELTAEGVLALRQRLEAATDHIGEASGMVAPAQSGWRSPSEIPECKKGDLAYRIVAVKRQHSGQTVTFSASYLNAVPLWFDDENDTRAVTGWNSDEEGDDGPLYRPLLGEGDELMGWMAFPVFAPGSPAEKGEGEPVRETIFNALRRYKLTNMVEAEDSGIGYPLIDLMSNDGTTIATGEAEMRVLADHISEVLEKAATHSASDQSDTERMSAALMHYACSCEPGQCAMSDDGGPDPVDAQLCGRVARAALAGKTADQCAAIPPQTRYFPADFAPAYPTVAAVGLALPADPLPGVVTLPGRHADPAAFAVNLSATIGDDAGACGICDVVFITGDRCLTDISLGPVHARCCGPERESYVDLETGDALAADAPIPTPWIWNGDGTISPAEVAA